MTLSHDSSKWGVVTRFWSTESTYWTFHFIKFWRHRGFCLFRFYTNIAGPSAQLSWHYLYPFVCLSVPRYVWYVLVYTDWTHETIPHAQRPKLQVNNIIQQNNNTTQLFILHHPLLEIIFIIRMDIFLFLKNNNNTYLKISELCQLNNVV